MMPGKQTFFPRQRQHPRRKPVVTKRAMFDPLPPLVEAARPQPQRRYTAVGLAGGSVFCALIWAAPFIYAHWPI